MKVEMKELARFDKPPLEPNVMSQTVYEGPIAVPSDLRAFPFDVVTLTPV